MRSRRTLWTLLGLGTLPFLLEATMGCDVVFGIQRVQRANSLYCDCKCDAGSGGPREVGVAMGSDDAEESGDGTVDLGNGDLDLGSNLVGIRFGDLAIPQGATIEHAFVQFVGDADGESDPTSLTIRAEASTTAPTFTTATGDVSGRMPGMFQVTWEPGPWNNGEAGLAQRTEDIKDLIQELVNDPAWNDGSSVVLIFEGSGQRSAESFEGSDQPPLLIVELDAAVAATLPICASEEALDEGLTASELVAECERVEATLSGIAGACGYPQPCTCDLVDLKDPSGGDRPDAVEAESCSEGCAPTAVDAPACDTFDPNAFTQCMANGGTLADCKQHVSATHAGSDSPVCVSSGSALAFHAFGERSRCELEGTADIRVGDRQPTTDPVTEGAVEIVGGPCPGASCPIYPSFGLRMNDIEFEVRWASNPTFHDLGAEGRGLETAAVPSSGDALFASDAILGTGVGRRGFEKLAIDATNPDPLGVGVHWAAKTCYMDGALAVSVGDDGTCEMDPVLPCASDADCAGVGGACVLPPPEDEMTIDVLLEGELVNQPPRAAAGDEQTVECTSSAGASFVLDGRGSSDPDRNLALATWHAGTRTGPLLGNELVIPGSLALGASETYVLRVVDGHAQTDESETSVEVVDTTPPDIACNAPATMTPPDADTPPSFAATATDVCDEAVAAQVVAYDCFAFTKKGRRVSKLDSCVVSFAGDTFTVLDAGGYGDHIQWTVRATDDSGNQGEKTCEVVVTKCRPGGGLRPPRPAGRPARLTDLTFRQILGARRAARCQEGPMRMDDMILVSVDDHVCEPPDLFERHVPAKWKDRAPRLLTKEDGSDVWFFENQQVPNVGLNAVAGRPADEYGMEPTALGQIRRGCWNLAARLDDMNANGVLGSLCFASMTGFTGELFSRCEEKELARVMAQAYNDWHIDDWCGGAPGRFIPLALPMLWDPKLTADEIRRVAKKGCHAMTFPDAPTGLGYPSLHSEHWEPIWRACDETGTVLCVHIGSGTGMNLQDQTAPVEIMITGTPITLFNFANEITYSKFLPRYKNLRFALSEGGIGWIPYFLERADYVYKHHHAWTHNEFGGRLPSDLFREHVVTCFIDDAAGVRNRDLIGVDTLTWECDYPHSDSTWPRSPEVLWESVKDVPKADVDAITHLNAMRHFRYDPFRHISREQATVGALRAKAKHVDIAPKAGKGGKKPSDYKSGYCTIGDIMQQMAGAYAVAFREGQGVDPEAARRAMLEQFARRQAQQKR